MRSILWGIAVVVAAVVLAYAWPDEAPLRRTDFFEGAQTAAAGEKSWFYGVYGVLAPADADPFAAGRAALAQYKTSGTLERPAGLAFPSKLEGCSGQPDACMDKIAPELIRDSAPLLARYRALYAASDFLNVLPPDANGPMPNFRPLVQMQQLFILAALHGADAHAAAAELDADLAHWRRALAGANTVFAKMIAAAAVARDLTARSQLMDRVPGLAPVEPLNAAELSLTPALLNEMAIDYHVTHHLQDYDEIFGQYCGWARRLPYKPVATFNRHIADYQPMLDAAELPMGEFAAAYAQLPAPLHAVRPLDYALNGKGVCVLRLEDATLDYGAYIFRVYDLQALAALVNIKRELLAGTIKEPGQSALTNPYAPQEHAHWDGAHKAVVFDTQPGEQNEKRVALSVAMPHP